MNYYGYAGGYSPYAYPYGGCAPVNPCCGGYGAAIILVLFILLVIVFGAGSVHCCNNQI